MKRRVRGGLLALIGYILSPLTWWNDALVNIPISYAMASLASYLIQNHFTMLFVASYLATNVAGFILLHVGAEHVLNTRKTPSTRLRMLAKYIIVSILYTFLVYFLAEEGYIKPIHEMAG